MNWNTFPYFWHRLEGISRTFPNKLQTIVLLYYPLKVHPQGHRVPLQQVTSSCHKQREVQYLTLCDQVYADYGDVLSFMVCFFHFILLYCPYLGKSIHLILMYYIGNVVNDYLYKLYVSKSPSSKEVQNYTYYDSMVSAAHNYFKTGVTQRRLLV